MISCEPNHCELPVARLLDEPEGDAVWSCFCESTREHSAGPATFHNMATIATTMIHKSNLARSKANSMSAAKRIERNTIRFISRRAIAATRPRVPDTAARVLTAR
jgi:hypothetical protein